MELMENRLQKQMRCMEQSNSTQNGIIADKVDALVAALSHCGISWLSVGPNFVERFEPFRFFP